MEITDALINAIFSAGAVYGVVKTELYFMRRDIDHAHKRIDKQEDMQLRRAEDLERNVKHF